MKITRIEIINNKAIKCFRVQLDGKNLTVAGDTGSGKTTAISGLWEDIIKKCPDAITHGAKKGSVEIELSDGSKTMICKRVNTASKSEITITAVEGNKVTTPSIKDFKRLISDLSVNPHRIIDMKPTEQIKTLAAAADMGDVDLQQMDDDITAAEAERLELSRAVDLLAPGAEPEKVERADLSALLQQKADADEANRERANKVYDLERMVEQGKSNNAEIDRLREQLATLEESNEKLRAEANALNKEVGKLEEIDTTDIVAAINSAEETNAKAEAHARWQEATKRHDEKVAERAEADAKVKALRAEKKAALDNAKWPIPGLSIEDGQVLYNGCLLSNLGTSEQMLVCAAISIADILAHPIHVVRLDGIEAMSKKDQKALEKLFNGHDIQVLETRVARGDIEEGEIVITEGEYSDA
jgi:DNA repair exonuclease SbcCD ATPase subunit